MGSIARFNLGLMSCLFNCKVFVETGTGAGAGLEHVLRFKNFRLLYSCEIMTSLFNQAQEKLFQHSRVKIINSASGPYLKALMPVIDSRATVLFWLDAHFPGADYGLRSYCDEIDTNTRLPLEVELLTICQLRRDFNDVIVIDDLRIYEDGPFQNGNLPSEYNTLSKEQRSIDFVYRLFNRTHKIIKDYQDEGYLILIPKGKLMSTMLWRAAHFLKLTMRKERKLFSRNDKQTVKKIQE